MAVWEGAGCETCGCVVVGAFTAGLEYALLVDWFVTGVGSCFECRAEAIVWA